MTRFLSLTELAIRGAVVYEIVFEKACQDLQGCRSFTDFGCGEITLAPFITAPERFGFDIEAEKIRKNQERYPDVKFIVADVNDLPLLNNTQDAVFAQNVFHYPQLQPAIQEMTRILQKKGSAVVIVMNRNFPLTVDIPALFRKPLASKEKARFSWQSGDYEPVMRDAAGWFTFFREAGLQVKKYQAFDGMLLNIVDMFCTILLRLSPMFLRSSLFTILLPLARFASYLETEVFLLKKTRSYYFLLEKM